MPAWPRGILTWGVFFESGGVIDAILGDLGLNGLENAFLADPHTATGALISMGFPGGRVYMLVSMPACKPSPQIPLTLLPSMARTL